MFIVCDVETTGMGPDDQVIEWAGVWPTGSASFLVKPTVPISVEALATHHISGTMLVGQPDAEIMRPVLEEYLAGRVSVFHNAEFDIRLMKQTWPGLEIAPHVCTYRCALHLWPDAPRHSNQVLRYWLGIEPTVATDLPPHRALADAAVTAAILEKMLETHDISSLIALTQASVVLHRVRFGQHINWLWKDVPHSYLQWILRKGEFDSDVIHTAKHYLGVT